MVAYGNKNKGDVYLTSSLFRIKNNINGCNIGNIILRISNIIAKLGILSLYILYNNAKYDINNKNDARVLLNGNILDMISNGNTNSVCSTSIPNKLVFPTIFPCVYKQKYGINAKNAYLSPLFFAILYSPMALSSHKINNIIDAIVKDISIVPVIFFMSICVRSVKFNISFILQL